MTSTLPPPVITARNDAMSRVESNAGEQFRTEARAIILRYLQCHEPTSGEDLADMCIAWGIRPHDQRAFGPVIAKLKRDGLIERAGYCARNKGHGTTGGNVWRISQGVKA